MVITFVGIAILVASGVALYSRLSCQTPKQSVAALGAAMKRRDRETIMRYVDAERLAASLRQYQMEVFHEQDSKPGGAPPFPLNLFASQIEGFLADSAITPELVIGMFCGESPDELLKKGLNSATDGTIDTVTKKAGPQAETAGGISKILIRGIVSYAIDQGAKEAAAGESTFNREQCNFDAVYETSSRFIIMVMPKRSDEPGIGFVLRRQGSIWRLSEVRQLPQHQG